VGKLLAILIQRIPITAQKITVTSVSNKNYCQYVLALKSGVGVR
jgi:hypothetical protein